MSNIYTCYLTSNPDDASDIFQLMTENGMEELELPAVPLTAINDFIAGTRSSIWDITLSDKTVMVMEGSKEAAQVMKLAIQPFKIDYFPLLPLPLENVRAFLAGERETLAVLEIEQNKEVKGAGHI